MCSLGASYLNVQLIILFQQVVYPCALPISTFQDFRILKTVQSKARRQYGVSKELSKDVIDLVISPFLPLFSLSQMNFRSG